jgi:hypothetical protein
MHAARMSPVRWVVATVLLVTVVGRAAGAETAAEPVDWVKSYAVSGHPEIHVHTNDGSVQVITSDTQQVEFRVKTTGSGWGIGLGDAPRIESRQDGNVVELGVHLHNFIMGFSTRHTVIEVRAPKSADLQLQTSDGSIDIAAVDGNVRASTSDGRVNVAQINGNVDVSTSDGSIEARTLKGDVKLRTSDGTIRATEIDGRCEASSSDGSVSVEGRFDNLDLHSGDGAVKTRIAAGSSITSGWQISTSDGSVEVAMPKDFKTSLDVSASEGRITLDVPVQVEGELSKSHIRGTLNGGGPSFRIHTSDGSIRLSGI